MWDLRLTVPEHIKIILTLWQPIDFKTLPQNCHICRSDSHLAYNCPQCPIEVEPISNDPVKRKISTDAQRNPDAARAEPNKKAPEHKEASDQFQDIMNEITVSTAGWRQNIRNWQDRQENWKQHLWLTTGKSLRNK
jgi:hypothetical protein